MSLTYEVTKDGQIINLRNGTKEDEIFALTVSIGGPQWRYHRSSKWEKLIEAIQKQPMDEWFIYSGFPDNHIMKNADNHLRNKFRKGKNFEFYIKLSHSTEDMAIAVMKIRNIENHA